MLAIGFGATILSASMVQLLPLSTSCSFLSPFSALSVSLLCFMTAMWAMVFFLATYFNICFWRLILTSMIELERHASLVAAWAVGHLHVPSPLSPNQPKYFWIQPPGSNLCNQMESLLFHQNYWKSNRSDRCPVHHPKDSKGLKQFPSISYTL